MNGDVLVVLFILIICSPVLFSSLPFLSI